MSLPVPKPGMVINYSYLWGYEHRKSQIEGSKDRPCAVVVVVNDAPMPRVIVLGITHVQPQPGQGLALSAKARRHLGLDDRPSWVITTEANMFTWPGPDLRPRIADDQSSFAFGYMPSDILAELRRRFRDHLAARQIRIIPRTED